MIDIKFNETFSPKTFPTTEEELSIYIETKLQPYLGMAVTPAVIEQVKYQLEWILEKAFREGVTKKKMKWDVQVNDTFNRIEVFISEE